MEGAGHPSGRRNARHSERSQRLRRIREVCWIDWRNTRGKMGAGQRIDSQAQPCSISCRKRSLRYSERRPHRVWIDAETAAITAAISLLWREPAKRPNPHLVWIDAETAAISLLWREPAKRPNPYAGLRREIGPEHRIIDSE